VIGNVALKGKMMFIYGVELLLWTETFKEKNLDLIGHAGKLGFDGVEIHLRYPEKLPVEDIREELKKQNMKACFVVILTEEHNPISEDEGTRKSSLDFFKKCIDAAEGISGEGAVIGGVNYAPAGYITGRSRTQQEWDWSVENFRQAARYAGERGIVLAVEPINRFETFFLNTAADAVQFCKDVGEPNAKVHLDTYHMIREEKSFYKPIVETGDYLGMFHTCENDRGTPGTGLVRWDDVYRGLHKIGYGSWIVIESFVPDIEELARVTAVWRKLAPSADHLAEEGLKNLRKIEQNTA
jgi:D-psicose/D-tagatose/L-ribulose 3-epimerase